MILKSKFFLLMLLFLFTSTNEVLAAKKRGEYATKNLLGQEYYLEACSSCHGEGSMGGNMASIREWKELFSKDSKELKYLHTEDEESILALKYLKSDIFINKQSKEILNFLQEFAYDSENIPTCN